MRAAPLALALLLLAAPARAADWAVNPAASEIAFSGTHSGRAFRGTFQAWTAEIAFDPERPEAARITVTVDLASARTGDATYDRTLPGRDWLDSASASKATFTATSVRRDEAAGRYVAEGTLSLRGASVPVALPFTFVADGPRAEATGRALLRRLDFAVGRGADASGAWVSLEVPVDVKVVATRR